MDGQQATRSAHAQERRWLGRAIREARARRGLSQEELGFRAGLHRNFVGALERGETNPTFNTLLHVMSGLDLALSVVVGMYERNAAEAS
jgi:transcriptional regulator with XRE-family HTH domain